MNQIHLAEQIARKAHVGTFRRDGKTPYIRHVESVVARVAGESKNIIATAWLHDVIEDCGLTASDLASQGITPRVWRLVLTLTRIPYEDYENFIRRIATNKQATIIKLADIAANLDDKPTLGQATKYYKAITLLTK